MKNFLLGAALILGLAMPAAAKNFAVPDKDPAVVLSVPDTWDTEEIAYGYSAWSPGKDVFFSVEFASGANVKGMQKNNETWMKENDINAEIQPQEVEMDFNGIKGQVLRFDTTDANGKTLVDFVIIPAGKQRVVMLTLWGSPEERKKHNAAIDQIMNSVRPIN
ncbi:MAG TPA: hypothetical protein VIL65_15215 [Beijerinckiaceae bacterium]|jgi:hypothetical protein